MVDRQRRRQAAEGVVPLRARALVASLAVRKAIRAARTPPAAGPDDAPATTANAAHAEALHDQASEASHAVDHPGRGGALTAAQRAATVHAHQQAAMPEPYLEGRTTDPATWLRTPENLERLAALTRAANARRRALEDGQAPAAGAASPVDQHR
ncbi:hypothetical protein [Streptomyces sp. NPDC047014]|uniref:hypothetical protein n=1 Tax=Streptomyces sp. NPDC047014 TaxID=3155736 RepID=UPI0033E6E3B4